MKTTTLENLERKIIGAEGTPEREIYEADLEMDIISSIIRKMRKDKNLTQSQLGLLVGVKKSTISKIENNPDDVTLSTLRKIFKALNSEIKLHIEQIQTIDSEDKSTISL